MSAIQFQSPTPSSLLGTQWPVQLTPMAPATNAAPGPWFGARRVDEGTGYSEAGVIHIHDEVVVNLGRRSAAAPDSMIQYTVTFVRNNEDSGMSRNKTCRVTSLPFVNKYLRSRDGRAKYSNLRSYRKIVEEFAPTGILVVSANETQRQRSYPVVTVTRGGQSQCINIWHTSEGLGGRVHSRVYLLLVQEDYDPTDEDLMLAHVDNSYRNYTETRAGRRAIQEVDDERFRTLSRKRRRLLADKTYDIHRQMLLDQAPPELAPAGKVWVFKPWLSPDGEPPSSSLYIRSGADGFVGQCFYVGRIVNDNERSCEANAKDLADCMTNPPTHATTVHTRVKNARTVNILQKVGM